ncbi:MAG: methyltransferase [Pirellulales bacterium]|nr:methyltransferase [Pirellulales bacterium]
MPNAATPTPAQSLQQMLTASWVTQAIYAAAKLDLAERIAGGPKTAAELAQETGMLAEPLFRLLRALVGLGLFKKDASDRFALTPVGELLRAGHPDSKRAMAIMIGEEHHRAWGELLYSLQTGKPAFDHVYGEPVFDYLAKHPAAGANFDAAMTAIHGRETAAMIEAYDFSGIDHLVDVGGGNGTLLSMVLARYPNLRGTLYDLPHVVDRNRDKLREAGIADRCRAVGGDFFQNVPTGANAYLMRHIIHDWDDERSIAILDNCRRAMADGGRVLLIEIVLGDDLKSNFGPMLDLNMLVMPGGKERTAAEYRQLFSAAGLKLSRIIPTTADVSVIEAVTA